MKRNAPQSRCDVRRVQRERREVPGEPRDLNRRLSSVWVSVRVVPRGIRTDATRVRPRVFRDLNG